MTANDATRLNQQLAERTGLSLGLLQRPALAGFVEQRCQELGLADALAYHELVMRDAGETERLVKEVSVPETWFFRYPASFDLLVEECRRRLRNHNDTLRMLSIACATGEEPYAMTMAALEAGWPLDRVDITAIDRDKASLAIARSALYRENSFRERIPQWAEQWFKQTNDGVQVNAKIASRVRFLCQDVLSGSWPTGRATYDIVFCRNLFIYLSDSAQAQLSKLILSLLSSSGILFVGHAEQQILPSDSFEPVSARRSFALVRKTLQPVSHRATPVGATPVGAMPPSKPFLRHDRTVPIAPPPNPATSSVANPVTRQDPTFADARALADSGRLQEALAILQDLQPLHADPVFFELLGSIQLSLGELQDARGAFNKVLYLEPDHEASLLQMAIIFDRIGNAEQASRFRQRAGRAHDRQLRQSPEEKS